MLSTLVYVAQLPRFERPHGFASSPSATNRQYRTLGMRDNLVCCGDRQMSRRSGYAFLRLDSKYYQFGSSRVSEF